MHDGARAAYHSDMAATIITAASAHHLGQQRIDNEHQVGMAAVKSKQCSARWRRKTPATIEPTDPTLRRRLPQEAKELMDNRAFKAAIQTLRQQWYAELIPSRDRPMLDSWWRS